ncbi:MAG: hypothetical protein ACOC8E_07375 [Planctomycetota bacterium]
MEIEYKKNADETVERLRLLWEERVQDRILAVFDVPGRALAEFAEAHPEGFCDYPDPHDRIAFWDRLLAERAALEDDSIPSAYLSEFDQGLYGGMLGGDVRFLSDPATGWISSMVPPLLGDWAEFDELAIDESHPRFRRYLDQLGVFVRGAEGKFGISHLILIDGLNFVFELVGATNTYLAIRDRPGDVRRAIDFAFDLNVCVHDAFFDAVRADERGTFSNMIQWHPGRIVSESVDPFHMTAVDDFETWGREPAQQILDRYDGGCLHIHGNGRHLLQAVCSLRGLKAIYMGDDRGFPLAINVAGELKRRAGDVPLVIPAEFEAFRGKLERSELPAGVLYAVSDAPDVDAANRCMDDVRAYRA